MPVRGEPMPSAAQGPVGQLGGRPPAPETIASPGFSLKDYASPRHENQLSLCHKKWTNEWGQLTPTLLPVTWVFAPDPHTKG